MVKIQRLIVALAAVLAFCQALPSNSDELSQLLLADKGFHRVAEPHDEAGKHISVLPSYERSGDLAKRAELPPWTYGTLYLTTEGLTFTVTTWTVITWHWQTFGATTFTKTLTLPYTVTTEILRTSVESGKTVLYNTTVTSTSYRTTEETSMTTPSPVRTQGPGPTSIPSETSSSTSQPTAEPTSSSLPAGSAPRTSSRGTLRKSNSAFTGLIGSSSVSRAPTTSAYSSHRRSRSITQARSSSSLVKPSVAHSFIELGSSSRVPSAPISKWTSRSSSLAIVNPSSSLKGETVPHKKESSTAKKSSTSRLTHSLNTTKIHSSSDAQVSTRASKTKATSSLASRVHSRSTRATHSLGSYKPTIGLASTTSGSASASISVKVPSVTKHASSLSLVTDLLTKSSRTQSPMKNVTLGSSKKTVNSTPGPNSGGLSRRSTPVSTDYMSRASPPPALTKSYKTHASSSTLSKRVSEPSMPAINPQTVQFTSASGSASWSKVGLKPSKSSASSATSRNTTLLSSDSASVAIGGSTRQLHSLTTSTSTIYKSSSSVHTGSMLSVTRNTGISMSVSKPLSSLRSVQRLSIEKHSSGKTSDFSSVRLPQPTMAQHSGPGSSGTIFRESDVISSTHRPQSNTKARRNSSASKINPVSAQTVSAVSLHGQSLFHRSTLAGSSSKSSASSLSHRPESSSSKSLIRFYTGSSPLPSSASPVIGPSLTRTSLSFSESRSQESSSPVIPSTFPASLEATKATSSLLTTSTSNLSDVSVSSLAITSAGSSFSSVQVHPPPTATETSHGSESASDSSSGQSLTLTTVDIIDSKSSEFTAPTTRLQTFTVSSGDNEYSTESKTTQESSTEAINSSHSQSATQAQKTDLPERPLSSTSNAARSYTTRAQARSGPREYASEVISTGLAKTSSEAATTVTLTVPISSPGTLTTAGVTITVASPTTLTILCTSNSGSLSAIPSSDESSTILRQQPTSASYVAASESIVTTEVRETTNSHAPQLTTDAGGLVPQNIPVPSSSSKGSSNTINLFLTSTARETGASTESAVVPTGSVGADANTARAQDSISSTRGDLRPSKVTGSDQKSAINQKTRASGIGGTGMTSLSATAASHESSLFSSTGTASRILPQRTKLVSSLEPEHSQSVTGLGVAQSEQSTFTAPPVPSGTSTPKTTNNSVPLPNSGSTRSVSFVLLTLTLLLQLI